jgi:hypothetical protein
LRTRSTVALRRDLLLALHRLPPQPADAASLPTAAVMKLAGTLER